MKKIVLILTIMLFTASLAFAAALSEGFEGTFPPTDWTNNGWELDTYGSPHSGSHHAYSDYATTSTLTTPALLPTAGDNTLTFWYSSESSSYSCDLEVYVNGNLEWSDTGFGATYQQANVDLSDYNNQTVTVEFKYDMPSYYGGVCLDDVAGPELYVPACPKPTDLTTTNITQTTAYLGWTEAGTATTWEYDYGVTGYGPPVGAGTSTTSNPVNITGLTAGTTYDWYVRADCGAKEVSDWAGPETFTTLCDPVTTYPYTEGFEDAWVGDPAAPPCWLVVDNNTDGDKWYQNTSSTYAHSGTKSATIYTDYNTANDDWLITPTFDLSAKTDYRLKFWTRARSSGEPEELQVLLSTTNNVLSSFTNVLMASTPIGFITYTEYILDLSAYNSSTVYIAFVRNQAPADGWYLYIDDVTVEEIPATPIISVDPDEKDFWLQIAGNSSDPQTFTISNIGGGTLTIADGDISLTGTDVDQFTLTDTNTYPINLTSGQTATVDVSFSPTTEGSKEANLTIVDNRGTTNIPLTGQALPSDYVFEGFENTTFPPAGWTTDGWTRSTYTVYEGNGSAYKYGSSSTQYILYTPLLNVSSGDLFCFWGRTSSSSGELEIVYSADGSTWTLLETITYSATNTWELKIVDLTTLAKSNVYIGFRTGLQSGSFYVDNVIHPPIILLPPDPPSNPNPADEAVDVLETADLNWTNGFATETVDVYFGTVDPPITKVLDNVAAVETYDPGTMVYSTEYFWKVVCRNSAKAEAEGPVWSFTVRDDPTLYPPFTEDFATWYPANWSKAQGLLAAPVTFTSTTTCYWYADGFANVGTTGAAKCNVYGTSRKEWMITPPINLGAKTNYQLEFDLALTDWGNTDPPESVGDDDKYAVIISTDNGTTWTSANALQIWDNTTTPSFADISTTGQHITIDLTAFSGLVKLGFYAESTVSNADNDLFVDNVQVREIPTTPIFSIDPALKDFGIVNPNESSAAETFTISNTGIGTLTINSVDITGTDAGQFTLTDPNDYPEDLTTNTISVDVTFDPTSSGAKSAFLTVIDDQARVTHDIPLVGMGSPQGSICADPLPLTLPAVDVSGNTVNYGDDYNREDIDPASYYLNGDDVVYQFTTTEEAILSGSIVTTGSWIGAFILIDCPNPTTPPTPVIQKTSTTTTLTYDDVLPAGTYFLIISSWPSPQSIDYIINLSVAPLGVPANVLISVDAAGLTTVSWDAVTSADSYIIYGCDTPYGTFTNISADGSFTGTSWTSTASLGDKKFIKITAVKTAKGIIPQPLTSEERRKLAPEKDTRR